MPSRKSPTTTYSEHIAALKELRRIPGVGPHIAQDLVDQGFRRVAELQGCDPQALYERSGSAHCRAAMSIVAGCTWHVARFILRKRPILIP